MLKPQKNTVFYILSRLYKGIAETRNILFDKRILKSESFDLPIIAVGNLSVGGTGKTPHTEWLIRLLSKKYNVAVLSRGYKRKSKGFVLAKPDIEVCQIGDEAFQIFKKYPGITVAVAEKRVHGVKQLLKTSPTPQIILLDDAYQHRYIKAGIYLLLTDYSKLFTEDHSLPYGTLREPAKNSKRADIVIVSKCPSSLTPAEAEQIKARLKLQPHQQLYFSKLAYKPLYPLLENSQRSTPTITNDFTVILITGIENPKPMFRYLNHFTKNIKPYYFPDHHQFSEKELNIIEEIWLSIPGNNKLIITTEKDAVRLLSMENLAEIVKQNTFVLPLEVDFVFKEDEKILTQKIYDYVRENLPNS